MGENAAAQLINDMITFVHIRARRAAGWILLFGSDACHVLQIRNTDSVRVA